MATTPNRKPSNQEAFDRLQAPARPRCWLCGRTNPTATSTLGGKGGARIPECARGQGCRAGQIYHGPLGASHYPSQDCPICGPGRRGRGAAEERPVADTAD